MSNPSPIPLWRNRDYLLLWGGQVVSAIGTQVSDFAFPLLLLALTKSPAQAGFVASLGALPYLVFSLPAGALVDRWDRKRVMILCDTVRALSLGSIPLAVLIGHLTIVQLYLVSLIEGTLFVFFNIAEVACLPRVVTKEQLPTVASQVEVTNSLSFLFGRSLGGLLFSVSSLFPFLADACSYAVSVISLFFIKTSFQDKRETAPRKLWVEIGEGLSWLWQQPLICYIAFLGCSVHIVGSGMILIVIVLAQQLHASSFVIGIVLGVGGIGTLCGALLGGFVQKRLSFSFSTIATQWLVALLFPFYLLAPNVLLLALIVALVSAFGTVYGVVQLGYRLALIPDSLQGRVNSVFRLVVFGGDPLGFALTGLLLQVFGTTLTLVFYIVINFLITIITMLNPYVRNAPPLAVAKKI